MAVKQTKWGKWIEDAIAANPQLSKAGLSKHLDHGQDRSRVLKMISGFRGIDVEEIEAIAAYLGVPPPLVSLQRSVIPVVGVIGPDPELTASIAATVPASADRRHPLESQRGYALGEPCPALSMLSGDVLITVVMDERPTITHGDIVVTEIRRGRGRRLGLAQAQHYSGGMRYAPLIGDTGGEAIARSIGIYRSLT